MKRKNLVKLGGELAADGLKILAIGLTINDQYIQELGRELGELAIKITKAGLEQK